jgi:hypothetical protein
MREKLMPQEPDGQMRQGNVCCLDHGLAASIDEVFFGRDGFTQPATHLMRYPEQLKAFGNLVANRLRVAKKTHGLQHFRVSAFSLAAATGEEPASIAAVGLDKLRKWGISGENDAKLSVVGIEKDPHNLFYATERLKGGFTLLDYGGPSAADDVAHVNSILGPIRGVVKMRLGDFKDVESIQGLGDADAVFINAALYCAFNDDYTSVPEFKSVLGDTLKPGAALFTTDLIFEKDTRFMKVNLPDFTYIYCKMDGR